MTAALFHWPGACSTVTQVALERCGLSYEIAIVDLERGEQHAPRYLALNPRGKVPALVIEDRVLTENIAILSWLNERFPDALLKPEGVDSITFLGDLAWCGAMLHPLVRQIRAPHRFTVSDVEGVRTHGIAHYHPVAVRIDARLAAGWWYGDQWSVLDPYLAWIAGIAGSKVRIDEYPNIAEHMRRVAARPESARARDRESAAMEARD